MHAMDAEPEQPAISKEACEAFLMEELEEAREQERQYGVRRREWERTLRCIRSIDAGEGVMGPIVYVDLLSPCAQSVALLARAVPGLEAVTLTEVSLANGDHMKPEFVKKFPMHSIPALEDDGFYMTESHAICPYLMSAYAVDDKLYPKNDHKKRAKIDQWLHFSNSIIYTRLRAMSEPIWRLQTKTVPDEKKEHVAAALTDMETMMGKNKWVCGNEMTLADICLACEVNAVTALFGDISKFQVVCAWLARCRAAMPGFDEIVLKGLESYKAALKHLMSA